MTEQEIKQLIDLYLDGATDTTQERALRRVLLGNEVDDPRAEGVLAMMAYTAEAARRERPARLSVHSRLRPALRMAAAVAVLAAVGLALWHVDGDDGQYSAYVACAETSEPATALDIMASQLRAMGDASDAVNEDLSSNFDAISDCLNSAL